MKRMAAHSGVMLCIKRKMTNVCIVFEDMEEGAVTPPGWNKVTSHLVSDVKMNSRSEGLLSS
jgi:hypothetical protein